MRPVLVAALLLVAAGCADGTSPNSAPGEYVLQSVNDKPLPYSNGSVTVLVGTVSGRRLAITREGDRLVYER